MVKGKRWHITYALNTLDIIQDSSFDNILNGDEILAKTDLSSIEELPVFFREAADDEAIRNKISKLPHIDTPIGERNIETNADHIVNNFRACLFNIKQDELGANESKPGEYDETVEHSFLLLPVIPHEGDTLQKKLKLLKSALDFLIFLKKITNDDSPINIQIMIGTRFNWSQSNVDVNRYSEEAKILTTNLILYVENSYSSWSGKLRIFPFGEISKPKNNCRGNLLDSAYEVDEIGANNVDIVIPINGITGNQLATLLRPESNFLLDRRKRTPELYAVPWFHEKKIVPVGEDGFKTDSNNSHQRQKKVARIWEYLQQVYRSEYGTNSKSQLVNNKCQSEITNEFENKGVWKSNLLSLLRACLSLYDEIEVCYVEIGMVHYLPVFKLLDKLSFDSEQLLSIRFVYTPLKSDKDVVTKVANTKGLKKLRIGISELRHFNKEANISISQNFINHLPIWGVALCNNPKLNRLINDISKEVRPYWHVYNENRFFVKTGSMKGLILSCPSNKSTVYRILTDSLKRENIEPGKDVIFAEEGKNREFDLLFKGIVDMAITVSPWAVVEKSIDNNQHITLAYEHLGETDDFTSLYVMSGNPEFDNDLTNNNFFVDCKVKEMFLDALMLLVDDEVNAFYKNTNLIGGNDSSVLDEYYEMLQRQLHPKYTVDKYSFIAGVYTICRSRIYNESNNGISGGNDYKERFDSLLKQILDVEKRQFASGSFDSECYFWHKYKTSQSLMKSWDAEHLFSQMSQYKKDTYARINHTIVNDHNHLNNLYHANIEGYDAARFSLESPIWSFIDEIVNTNLVTLATKEKERLKDSFKSKFVRLHTDVTYEKNKALLEKHKVCLGEESEDVCRIIRESLINNKVLLKYFENRGWGFETNTPDDFTINLHFYYMKEVIEKYFPEVDEKKIKKMKVIYDVVTLKGGDKYCLLLFSYGHTKPNFTPKFSSVTPECGEYCALDRDFIETCIHSFFSYKDRGSNSYKNHSLNRVLGHSLQESFDGSELTLKYLHSETIVVNLTEHFTGLHNSLLGLSFKCFNKGQKFNG